MYCKTDPKYCKYLLISFMFVPFPYIKYIIETQYDMLCNSNLINISI